MKSIESYLCNTKEYAFFVKKFEKGSYLLEIPAPALFFIYDGTMQYRNAQQKFVSIEKTLLCINERQRVPFYCKTDVFVLIFQFILPLEVLGMYPLDFLSKRISTKSIVGQLPYINLKPELLPFVKYTSACLSLNQICPNFVEWRKAELFSFFKQNYSLFELRCLFDSVIEKDFDFKQFVLDNIEKVENINDWAKLSHMSVSSFKRNFKKIFGESPGQYLRNYKHKKIKEALLKTDKPIKDLAIYFNFSTASNFSQYCKKEFGDTPSNIRENNFKCSYSAECL